MKNKFRRAVGGSLFGFALISRAALGAAPATQPTALLDQVRFGDDSSERSHDAAFDRADVVAGAASQPARQLQPPTDGGWQGGDLRFHAAVDPDRLTYVTVKFWGSDASPDRQILFCDGKQIGYRHLGDVDILDFGNEGVSGGCPGRFYYVTTPLPVELTRGQHSVDFEVRSTGPVWGYAGTFEAYQKPMTVPAKPIYAIYTHTDGAFVPPADQQAAPTPADPPVRTTPGPEVLDQLKDRVNRELAGYLAGKKPLTQMQLSFVARSYHVSWSAGYRNPQTVKRVVDSLDDLFRRYRADPKLAQSEPSTYNPGWFGLGPAGDAMFLLADPLKPLLDDKIDDGAGAQIARRAAYSEMLVASRDWHRQHRREYSNQTLITDSYMAAANRGVAAVDPAHALPAAAINRYLYESAGLEPWLGSDDAEGRPTRPLGDHYFELTQKSLTRELGFVGYYGEVLDWMTLAYDVTRPAIGAPGDPRMRAALERALEARSNFRYPALDDDGNRAMRIETIVGWRDAHYPGEVCYGQRTSWDGSSLQATAATLDPVAIGYAQQMFDDDQFFAAVQRQLGGSGLRVTAGLLDVPDQYALIRAQPASVARLPMSANQPDHVFSDEEDGVIAIKRGDEILYFSLYWRSRYAVNFLARVHDMTPAFDRIAVVNEDVQFDASGQTFKRPDIVNFGFGNGGPKYPVEMHSALAGEVLPIAKIPAGVAFKPGDESPYAGKGNFYTLRYGRYLIGMNCTADRTFSLTLPTASGSAPELVSGRDVPLAGQPLPVKPRSTVVLELP